MPGPARRRMGAQRGTPDVHRLLRPRFADLGVAVGAPRATRRPRRARGRGGHPGDRGRSVARRGARQDDPRDAARPAVGPRAQPARPLLRVPDDPGDVRPRAQRALALDGRHLASCGRTGTPPCVGSRGPSGTATSTATASSSTGRARRSGFATRRGRTRTRRSATSMGASSRSRSRPSRSRRSTPSRWSGWPRCMVALGEDDRAEGFLSRADDLRRRWHDAYWMPDERYYALALDGEKRQVRSIASNPGHALGAGIVPPEHARDVADRLLSDELFSGWGVRTLSTRHPSYDPFAYHLGAVWPVEQATFALGMKRYGLDDHVERLAGAMLDAAFACPAGRLPEALSGHDRGTLARPVIYPDANDPQAWSSSAVVQLVQIMLGIYPFAPLGLVALVRPRLPAWLPELTLADLRVGRARLTLRFRRAPDGSAHHEIVERRGRVVVVPVGPAAGRPDGSRTGRAGQARAPRARAGASPTGRADRDRAAIRLTRLGAQPDVRPVPTRNGDIVPACRPRGPPLPSPGDAGVSSAPEPRLNGGDVVSLFERVAAARGLPDASAGRVAPATGTPGSGACPRRDGCRCLDPGGAAGPDADPIGPDPAATRLDPRGGAPGPRPAAPGRGHRLRHDAPRPEARRGHPQRARGDARPPGARAGDQPDPRRAQAHPRRGLRRDHGPGPDRAAPRRRDDHRGHGQRASAGLHRARRQARADQRALPERGARPPHHRPDHRAARTAHRRVEPAGRCPPRRRLAGERDHQAALAHRTGHHRPEVRGQALHDRRPHLASVPRPRRCSTSCGSASRRGSTSSSRAARGQARRRRSTSSPPSCPTRSGSSRSRTPPSSSSSSGTSSRSRRARRTSRDAARSRSATCSATRSTCAPTGSSSASVAPVRRST